MTGSKKLGHPQPLSNFVLLWKRVLSNKQLKELRFLRQRPIGNYIVDFFCPELFLIIEIDGNAHLNKGLEDMNRQKELEKMGYTVVRLTESEVLFQLKDTEAKLLHIVDCLSGH